MLIDSSIIEWRVKLNNRVVVKDIKQDLTQPPRSYWEQIKEDACNILRRKTARGRRVRLDDTNIVLSVNSQRDIDKHFEGTSVDWTALLAWASLFRRGKTIRLQITINYIEDSRTLPSRTDKRGKSSTLRLTPSKSPVNIPSGAMCIVLYDIPGRYIATKDNTASKIQREKGTID
ncbi:hypothetical protein N7491_004997 [Penicillium cf. griseofulvum]|nr:hypothetical protein N7491_004997 [Penicillium cf. griseofulvum]